MQSQDSSSHWFPEHGRAFLGHLAILSSEARGTDAEILDEMFRVVQFARSSEAASALARMAARFSTADNALASRVRERQDTTFALKHTEEAIARAAAKPTAEFDLVAARKRVKEGLLSLPWTGLKLSRGEPAIPTIYEEPQ